MHTLDASTQPPSNARINKYAYLHLTTPVDYVMNHVAIKEAIGTLEAQRRHSIPLNLAADVVERAQNAYLKRSLEFEQRFNTIRLDLIDGFWGPDVRYSSRLHIKAACPKQHITQVELLIPDLKTFLSSPRSDEQVAYDNAPECITCVSATGTVPESSYILLNIVDEGTTHPSIRGMNSRIKSSGKLPQKIVDRMLSIDTYVEDSIKRQDPLNSQVWDWAAVRLFAETESGCMRSLVDLEKFGFAPIEGTFKDYIAQPKGNGYQSLHMVFEKYGIPVEFQIRTREMDDAISSAKESHHDTYHAKKELGRAQIRAAGIDYDGLLRQVARIFTPAQNLPGK